MDPDPRSRETLLARAAERGAAAATLSELWSAVHDVLAADLPGASIALFLRCPVTDLWQQLAPADHSPAAVSKTFVAVRPALAHVDVVVHWADDHAYVPVRDAQHKVVGCVLVVCADGRRVAPIAETTLAGAVATLAAGLGRIRSADEERLTRRSRVALQTLPRLVYEAATPERLRHAVAQTVAFVVPGARVHPFQPHEAAAGGRTPISDAARTIAHESMRSERLLLTRPSGAMPLDDDARQLAAAPLRGATGRHDGALVVALPIHGRVYEERDVEWLAAIAAMYALGHERLALAREVRSLHGEDPATGWGREEQLDAALQAVAERSEEPGHATALVLLEVDPDEAAPPDATMVSLGPPVLAVAAAEGVLAFRCGRERLAIVVPDGGLRRATQVAHRLRAVVRTHGGDADLTACCGIAVVPLHVPRPEGLWDAADAALAAARREGRDRQRVADVGSATPTRGIATIGERYDMLRGLAHLVDDEHFGGRPWSRVVSAASADVAVLLGLEHHEVETAALAGELHAIGRALLPPAILRDPFPSPALRALISSHAVLGGRLATLAGFAHVGEAIGALHESWDGTGTPGGLRGAAIPIAARIVAVVTTWQTVDSSPGAHWEVGPAGARRLRETRGTVLDPAIVDRILAVHASAA